MTSEEARIWFVQECENGVLNGEYQAFSRAIEALEKQTPKKPIYNKSDEYSASCPNCGNEILTHWLRGGIWYCERCGQAMNWSKD